MSIEEEKENDYLEKLTEGKDIINFLLADEDEKENLINKENEKE